MTTATATSAGAGSPTGTRSRIVPVLRLHLTNKWTTIGTPLLILLFIWAVNWVIWLLIWQAAAPDDRASAMQGTQYSGAGFYIFVFMLVVGIQTVARTFPFALGFSVTRRDFFLGTALLFASLSVFYTVLFTVLSYVEEATGGWGVGGHMFSTIWFGSGPLLERFAQLLLLFLFFFFVGAATSTVYLRWRANGMIVLWCGVALILLGVVVLVTLTNRWPAIGAWAGASGPFGVTAWSLVITVVAAVFGYIILRRATPVS